MAFTPVDIPIQEMLQTDFVVDLASIHNTNVLLLKDKLEDLLNNLEIDLTAISIGTDNPINNIRSTDYIIQDGGFVFQTGVPNQIIARLSKNVNSESVLNIDHLTIDLDLDAAVASIESLTVTNDSEFQGNVVMQDMVKYESSLVESKENVTVTLNRDGTTDAIGTITLTNDSKRNIFVTLTAQTAIGPTQVYTGGSFLTGITDLILNIDFDASNPPDPNQKFTIYLVDVLENETNSSIISVINSLAGAMTLSIVPGVNQSTTNDIVMHHDLVAEGQKLQINYSSPIASNAALVKYGPNVTFNYIVDADLNDRLLIVSSQTLEIV